MKVVRKSNAARILKAQTQAIFTALATGVKEGVKETEHLCPVDKGDLLSTRTVEDDAKGHVTFGIGGPSRISDLDVKHHVFIEYGTVKMLAQPNYVPGVEAAKIKVKEQLKNVRGS